MVVVLRVDDDDDGLFIVLFRTALFDRVLLMAELLFLLVELKS